MSIPFKPITATASKFVEINPRAFEGPLVLFGILRIARGFFLCKKPRVFRLNFWKKSATGQSFTSIKEWFCKNFLDVYLHQSTPKISAFLPVLTLHIFHKGLNTLVFKG